MQALPAGFQQQQGLVVVDPERHSVNLNSADIVLAHTLTLPNASALLTILKPHAETIVRVTRHNDNILLFTKDDQSALPLPVELNVETPRGQQLLSAVSAFAEAIEMHLQTVINTAVQAAWEQKLTELNLAANEKLTKNTPGKRHSPPFESKKSYEVSPIGPIGDFSLSSKSDQQSKGDKFLPIPHIDIDGELNADLLDSDNIDLPPVKKGVPLLASKTAQGAQFVHRLKLTQMFSNYCRSASVEYKKKRSDEQAAQAEIEKADQNDGNVPDGELANIETNNKNNHVVRQKSISLQIASPLNMTSSEENNSSDPKSTRKRTGSLWGDTVPVLADDNADTLSATSPLLFKADDPLELLFAVMLTGGVIGPDNLICKEEEDDDIIDYNSLAEDFLWCNGRCEGMADTPLCTTLCLQLWDKRAQIARKEASVIELLEKHKGATYNRPPPIKHPHETESQYLKRVRDVLQRSHDPVSTTTKSRSLTSLLLSSSAVAVQTVYRSNVTSPLSSRSSRAGPGVMMGSADCDMYNPNGANAETRRWFKESLSEGYNSIAKFHVKKRAKHRHKVRRRLASRTIKNFLRLFIFRWRFIRRWSMAIIIQRCVRGFLIRSDIPGLVLTLLTRKCKRLCAAIRIRNWLRGFDSISNTWETAVDKRKQTRSRTQTHYSVDQALPDGTDIVSPLNSRKSSFSPLSAKSSSPTSSTLIRKRTTVDNIISSTIGRTSSTPNPQEDSLAVSHLKPSRAQLGFIKKAQSEKTASTTPTRSVSPKKNTDKTVHYGERAISILNRFLRRTSEHHLEHQATPLFQDVSNADTSNKSSSSEIDVSSPVSSSDTSSPQGPTEGIDSNGSNGKPLAKLNTVFQSVESTSSSSSPPLSSGGSQSPKQRALSQQRVHMGIGGGGVTTTSPFPGSTTSAHNSIKDSLDDPLSTIYSNDVGHQAISSHSSNFAATLNNGSSSSHSLPLQVQTSPFTSSTSADCSSTTPISHTAVVPASSSGHTPHTSPIPPSISSSSSSNSSSSSSAFSCTTSTTSTTPTNSSSSSVSSSSSSSSSFPSQPPISSPLSLSSSLSSTSSAPIVSSNALPHDTAGPISISRKNSLPMRGPTGDINEDDDDNSPLDTSFLEGESSKNRETLQGPLATLGLAARDFLMPQQRQMIMKMHSILYAGVEVTKHSKSGKPHKRFLYCDATLSTLFWRETRLLKKDSAISAGVGMGTADKEETMTDKSHQAQLDVVHNKAHKRRSNLSFMSSAFRREDADREILISEILEVRDDRSSTVMKRSLAKHFVAGNEPTCVISIILDERSLDFEVEQENWGPIFHALQVLVSYYEYRRTLHEI